VPEWVPPAPPALETRHGEIELLPPLGFRPAAGKAEYTSPSGFTVHLEWQDHAPFFVLISGPLEDRVRLRFGEATLDLIIGGEGHLGFTAKDFQPDP
jgi:hypothetical protein